VTDGATLLRSTFAGFPVPFALLRSTLRAQGLAAPAWV